MYDFTNEVRLYGLDIETHDPYLTAHGKEKARGLSCDFNAGCILCIAMYDYSNNKIIYYDTMEGFQKVADMFYDSSVCFVGTKITYDAYWIAKTMHLTEKWKCRFIDICFAEFHLDEFSPSYSLDTLAVKYLNEHKQISELEKWAVNKGYNDDPRKHLLEASKEVPDLLEAYVCSDATQPVRIWKEQEKLLREEGIIEPFFLDCLLIPVVLDMKMRGTVVDIDKKHEVLNSVEETYNKQLSIFQEKYGEINFNSTKQLAAYFDKVGVEYKNKITVKTRNGEKAPERAMTFRNLVREETGFPFTYKKDKLVYFCSCKESPRVCSMLETLGYTYTCNPNLDKNAMKGLSESFPDAKLIMDLKQCSGIISKILGEDFDRFLGPDGRIHPDFNICKDDDKGTKSGRFSSSNPNAQQFPSKGILFEGSEHELALGPTCRSLFVPEEGCWSLKIDYSQVEYRLTAHCAVGPGADEIREKYRNDRHTDYHQFVIDLTGLQRKYAKNCNFGILYGMSYFTMAESFGWTLEHAEEIYNTYIKAVPFAKTTLETVGQVALNRATGKQYKKGRCSGYDRGSAYITSVAGRRLRMDSPDGTYKMLNRLNQGSSADIMKKAMYLIWSDDFLYKTLGAPHITVHDELFMSIPKTADGIKAVLMVEDIMENCIPVRVPLLAEPELGYNWYDVPFEIVLNDDDSHTLKFTHEDIGVISGFVFEDGKYIAKPTTDYNDIYNNMMEAEKCTMKKTVIK